jgi:membrane protease YdiL (CAAX protease family)
MKLKVLLTALPVLAFPPITYHFLPVSTTYGYWIADIFLRIGIPLICLWLLYKQGVRPRDYGLLPLLGRLKVPEFIVLCVVCTVAFLMYVYVDGIARVCLEDFGLISDPKKTSKDAIEITSASVLYYLTTASFFEEIFFRGVLGIVFLTSRKMSAVVYVLVSATSFTVAHSLSDLANMISVFYLGLIAAFVYLLSRNLWPLIIAHFITDAAVTAWQWDR